MIRRLAGCVAMIAALALWLAPAASAATPFQTIHSAGPLTNIFAGNELSCQVTTGTNSRAEFFPGAADVGDCGTFLAITADGSQQLFGPDFANHGAGSAASFSSDYIPFTSVRQTGVTGSGTAQNPYQVTTVVSATDPTLNVTLTQVDSYVTGNDFYTSNLTVQNTGDTSFNGQILHAADCFLRGFDTGFGAVTGNTAACTINANNSPASALEQFTPVSPSGNFFEETSFGSIWSDTDSHTFQPYNDQCNPDCTTNQDNAMGIGWSIGLGIGGSTSFSWQTKVVDPSFTLTGGKTFTAKSVNGTLATISDSDTNTTPSSYSASVNWGDGTSDQNATITGSNGSFSVADSHTYSAPGSYTITITVGYTGNPASNVSTTDAADVPGPPTTVGTAAQPTGSTSARLAGSGTPNGSPTTGHWIYGLDATERGPGFSGNIYDQSTPPVSLGSGFSSQTVSFVVTNLLPNARYHARFVATNGAGTTTGPDVTFTTTKAAVPSPVLGKENFTPIGTVFVLLNGQFVKLTQTLQLPSGTVLDTLQGAVSLVAAGGGSGKASDAKAKKRKKPTKATGTFGGAIFKFTQAKSGPNKGLTTLSIVEGAAKGTPTYASCKAKGARDRAHVALSSRILQTLRSRSSGRFRTRGRYAAGTVRGTKWTTTDRCDGTLIAVQQHSVLVTDLVRHKTILVTAGHHYLAKAPTRRKH